MVKLVITEIKKCTMPLVIKLEESRIKWSRRKRNPFPQYSNKIRCTINNSIYSSCNKIFRRTIHSSIKIETFIVILKEPRNSTIKIWMVKVQIINLKMKTTSIKWFYWVSILFKFHQYLLWDYLLSVGSVCIFMNEVHHLPCNSH